MEKTYILLRSGKQQGPFTLAQLAKMDLHPEDLVNVQGGVVGWQYATEIDVLQPYLSGYLGSDVPVADRSPDPVVSISPAPLGTAAPAPESLPAEVPQALKPPVPKSEESTPEVAHTVPKAAGVFASFPEGTELSPSGLELKRAASLVPESATKPSVIHPAATRPAKAAPISNANPIEVKPAKKRAPSRKQAASVAPRKKVKPAIVLSSLLALAVLAFAVGRFATGSDKNVSITNESGNTNLSATAANSDTSVEDNRSVLQQELPMSKTNEASVAAPPIAEAAPNTAAIESEDNTSDGQELVSAPDSQRRAADNTGEGEAIEVAKPAAKEPAKAGPDLTEQIYLKSNFVNNDLGEGVFDLNISMDNKSDKLLKTVAVNIFFTDNDGKTLNKQTIYFSNVKPGETIVRPASQHKLATRVRCELGLVSSEGLLYYAN